MHVLWSLIVGLVIGAITKAVVPVIAKSTKENGAGIGASAS